MPQVMFSFFGLCTFIDDLPGVCSGLNLPNLPPHRVVLGNFDESVLQQHGLGWIAQHQAKIQFFYDQFDPASVRGPLPQSLEPDSMVFDLSGQTLRIANATGAYFNNAACLPHMRKFITDPSAILPPSPVVYAEDPLSASCYVDFASGTITGLSIPTNNSVTGIMQLVIDTDTDPELEIWPFGESEPTIVTLYSSRTNDQGQPIPAGVNVMNFAHGEGRLDDDRDFRLNYLLVANPVTPIPPGPQDVSCPLSPWTYNLPPDHPISAAGPGCSNTNYP